MGPEKCCSVSYSLHRALPVRHDVYLLGGLVPLSWSRLGQAVRQMIYSHIKQTHLKWNNNSGDNSTIDGLGTTGFELAPAASWSGAPRPAVSAILCSVPLNHK
jgi:hypothetical protein